MRKLLFGTAGVPESAETQSSFDGITRISEVGLGCMELEFVYGVKLGEKEAERIRRNASSLGVFLTAHAPYFINLTSTSSAVVRASKRRIMDAARMGWLSGARSVAFHPGFYGAKSPRTVFAKVARHLQDIREKLESEEIGITLRPEVTGRLSQFGSLEETLELCREVKGLLPCIDFSHIFARSLGRINDVDAFSSVLDSLVAALGRSSLSNLHLHVSGMTFGLRGERRHEELTESSFNYKALLEALALYGGKGVVICETTNTEKDALRLARDYGRISKRIAAKRAV